MWSANPIQRLSTAMKGRFSYEADASAVFKSDRISGKLHSCSGAGNPLAFRKLTVELVRQSECGEGQFVLSQRDMPLDCASHLNVLLDFIHVETVDKRIQTKAINSLLRSAQEMLTQEICRFTLILQE